ncbi:MAG: hypothetical protein FWF08_03215 [Oscillospiraceae bacterium]|nr:hypothetical protein [Oscillospiraceae bacterium]
MEFAEKDILKDNEKTIWVIKPNRQRLLLSFYLRIGCLILLIITGFVIIAPFITNYFLSFRLLLFFSFCAGVSIFLIHSAKNKLENRKYIFTDKRIIYENGIAASNYKSVYYFEISDIDVHLGYYQ